MLASLQSVVDCDIDKIIFCADGVPSDMGQRYSSIYEIQKIKNVGETESGLWFEFGGVGALTHAFVHVKKFEAVFSNMHTRVLVLPKESTFSVEDDDQNGFLPFFMIEFSNGQRLLVDTVVPLDVLTTLDDHEFDLHQHSVQFIDQEQHDAILGDPLRLFTINDSPL